MEYAVVIGGNLNLREEQSTKSIRITSIPSGATVAVIEYGLEWCKVAYNAYTGYVMSKYLQFNSDSDNAITISISRETAKELFDALKLSLAEE